MVTGGLILAVATIADAKIRPIIIVGDYARDAVHQNTFFAQASASSAKIMRANDSKRRDGQVKLPSLEKFEAKESSKR